MGARRHLGCDFVQMPLHGLGVAAGEDEGGADAAIGTDGAEDVSRLGALIVRRRGAGTLLGPAAGDLVLLSDPGFILPPQFYVGSGRQGGPHLCQRGGKAFLKSSMALPFWAEWRGRADSLRNPIAFSSRPTVVSSSEMPKSSKIH